MGMSPRVGRPLLRPRSEVLAELRRRELRRERQEFGGRIQWEAAFFGLLAAIGLAGEPVAPTSLSGAQANRNSYA